MFLCAFIYFVLYCFYILKQMADHELDSVTIRKLLSTRHFKSKWMHKVSPHGKREGDHQKKYLLELAATISTTPWTITTYIIC